MKRLSSLLALAVLLPVVARAGAQSKNIHEQVDPYSGLRTLFLEVSTRACPGDPSPGEHDPQVHLLFSAVEGVNHTVSFFATPELDGGYVLNMRAKGTMDTLIDGVAGTWTTPAGSTVVTDYSGGRSYLHETVPFQVSEAGLNALGSAAWFQFRVNGPRQDVQRCTDAKRLRDVAEFVHAALAYGQPLEIAPPQQQHGSREASSGQAGDSFLTFSDTIQTHACAVGPTTGSTDAATEPSVALNAMAERRPDRTVRYFLVTGLEHGAPLDLRSKGTLETQMDGVAQSFHTPHGSVLSNKAAPDGRPELTENIAFHVDRRNIVALSRSSAFQFRIDGPHEAVERCADGKQLQQLAKFLDTTAGLYDHPVGGVRQ